MQPRKARFAEDYIGETVESYDACAKNQGHDAGDLRWATDVLEAYFSLVDASPAIARAKESFEQARAAGVSAGTDVPYPRSEVPALRVSTEDFRLLCLRRRSVRWFQPRRVERELIVAATDIAKLAPSACNRQPFEFRVADRPEEAAAIASLAMGTAGFASNLPALAVVVGDLSAFPLERDRHVIYIDGSLAAMQFMLALETLVLASCPINWPDIDAREAAMAKHLGLKPYERVVMLIGFGYAKDDGLIPFSRKRSSLLSWVEPRAE